MLLKITTVYANYVLQLLKYIICICGSTIAIWTNYSIANIAGLTVAICCRKNKFAVDYFETY